MDKTEDSATYEALPVEEEWTASEQAFFGAGEALEVESGESDSFDDLEPVPSAAGTRPGFLSRILRR
jgi:hypothetical protein